MTFASTAAPLVLGDAAPCPAFHVLLSAPSRADAWLAMEEGGDDGGEEGEEEGEEEDVRVDDKRPCLVAPLSSDVSTCVHTCPLMNLTADTMYAYALVSPDGSHRFASAFRTPAGVAVAEPHAGVTGIGGSGCGTQLTLRALHAPKPMPFRARTRNLYAVPATRPEATTLWLRATSVFTPGARV